MRYCVTLAPDVQFHQFATLVALQGGADNLFPAFTVITKAAESSARPSTMLPATAAKWLGPTSTVCTSASNQLVSQRHSSRAEVAARCHCVRNVLGFLGIRPAAKRSRQLQSIISSAADSKTALDGELTIRVASRSLYAVKI